MNRDAVRESGLHCGDKKIATVYLDATIIESWKKQARMTYEGVSGYQPMPAFWAEMNVALAGEFRDHNVPAHRAFGASRQADDSSPDTPPEPVRQLAWCDASAAAAGLTLD